MGKKYIAPLHCEYNNKGYITKLVTKDNINVLYNYSDNGNLIEKNTENVCKQLFEYDNKGRIIRIFSPDIELDIIFNYDSNNRIIERIHNGDLTIYEYYDNKFLKREIASYGVIFEYSENGNLLKKIYNNDRYKKYYYDDKWNIVKEEYSNGIIKNYLFKYDSLGRVSQINNCHIKYLV